MWASRVTDGGQGGELMVVFGEFGSSEGLVYVLSSLDSCVLMSQGIVYRNRELPSRSAEMDVGSSISYWSICHLEWAVGPLGKRLSHLFLFKDTCFVFCQAFSIFGQLSLSWLNPRLLFRIRVLHNWTHINRYSLKTAVDHCSSLSGTNAQSCGACFIQMTVLWGPVQWGAASVLLLCSSNCHFSVVSSCTGPDVKGWGFLPSPL